MTNIKKMDHYNNHKMIGNLNIQPTSRMKDIAERFNQLNQGLITVSDIVRLCSEYGWDVQSFTLSSCNLIAHNPPEYQSLLGIKIQRIETLAIYFDKDGVITSLSGETCLVEVQ